MKEIRIGVLGFGTIAKSLIEIIRENHTKIMKEYGINLIIKRVYSEGKNTEKILGLSEVNFTGNIEEIIFGERIDILCEALEEKDSDFVRRHILKGLKGRKPIILSSKNALASDMKEIIKAVADNKIEIRYDACVGGGIPVGKIFETTFSADTVTGIGGIISGDANYTYTIMEKKNIDFNEAVEELKKIKYSETSVTKDIIKHDILDEIVILGLYSMNTVISIGGLKNTLDLNCIKKEDFRYLRNLGYTIKPFGILKKLGGELSYYVGPVALKKENVLNGISKDSCFIFLEGERYGRLGLYSQKSGGDPTALAMFDDLINLLTLKKSKNPVKIDVHENSLKTDFQGEFLMRVALKGNTEKIIQRVFLQEKVEVTDISNSEGELIVKTSQISWDKKEQIAVRLMQDGITIRNCLPIFC